MRRISLLAGHLNTSRLGFGTSSLHHLRSARERAALLHHCFSRGLRHFDTAPLYGHEMAERELGRFIRERRSEVIVATKFGIQSNRWFARSPALLYAGMAIQYAAGRSGLIPVRPRRKDFSKQQMTRSLEQSLRNLQSDYVDLYLAHEPTEEFSEFSDELVHELLRIREAGKARYLGFAGGAGHCLALAKRYPTVADVLQIEAEASPRKSNCVHDATLDRQITFGCFRAALKGAIGSARLGIIRHCAERAALENPNGVILFSARSATRIDEILSVFGHVEGVAAI
jgi:aryl-alcohol dehydrogenase-like predicted oxidoreductase